MELEGVDEGVISEAKLRPLKMGRFTLPSAASQAPRADCLMPLLKAFEGINWVTLERRVHDTVTNVATIGVVVPDETTGEEPTTG